MQAGGVLPDSEGTTVHNHWEPYQSFDNCERAFCNVHHLRELVVVIERDHAPWARAMNCLVVDIKPTVDTAKSEGKPRLPAKTVIDFSQQYRQIVDEGLQPYLVQPKSNSPPKRSRKKQTKTKNLLDR